MYDVYDVYVESDIGYTMIINSTMITVITSTVVISTVAVITNTIIIIIIIALYGRYNNCICSYNNNHCNRIFIVCSNYHSLHTPRTLLLIYLDNLKNLKNGSYTDHTYCTLFPLIELMTKSLCTMNKMR